ncbi:MAG: hypothetical protein WKG03_14350, partial [Telluria sp.]
IYKFVRWFYYQLNYADFEFLTFVTVGAFKAYQYLIFMAIEAGAESLDKLMGDTYLDLSRTLGTVLTALDKSDKRNKLAERVIGDRQWLKYSSPETKGMLLFQLTRHGVIDNLADVGISGWFQTRKAAVLVILGWIQTVNEWNAVMNRVSKTGAKNGSSRGLLIAFLQQGWNRHEEMIKMEENLREKPLRGRKIHPNPSPAYAMHTTESAEYTSRIA